MRASAAFAALLLLGLAGRAVAPGVVVVVDGTATLAEVAPTVGAPALRWSTSDPVRFSNEGATEPQLLVYTASNRFRYDRDASESTTSVTHQGTTTTLMDNLYVAQSSGGAFLPAQVLTASDLTGQAGWTPHSGCGTVVYQGQLTIPWYSNAGVAQAAMTRYYQVCDTSLEIYVDADKDLSSGADLAYVQTHQRVLPEEADYEIVLQGTDYAFASAGSATSVTLLQGRFQANPLTAGATTVDAYFLYRFPDGFPAGVTTTTLTASAQDIMV